MTEIWQLELVDDAGVEPDSPNSRQQGRLCRG